VLLGFSTGVGRFALLGETSLVADADAVLVVVTGMGAGQVLMAGLIHLAVAGDVVVVAGEAEAGLMAGNEGRNGEWAVLAGGTAVNDD